MADKVPKEVDLQATFAKEAKDESMIQYLKSLGIDPNYVYELKSARTCLIRALSF